MNNEYNLSILEALFKDHLNAEKVSKVTMKNYRSDVKYFITWFYVYIRPYIESLGEGSVSVSHIEVFILHSTKGLIEEFKGYLISSNIPLKTINRRLSSIRKFYAFCVNRGYFDVNPTNGVTNHKIILHIEEEEETLPEVNVEDGFEIFLSSNLNGKNKDKVLEDYREFVNLWD